MNEQFIQRTNNELNTVVQHLKNDDIEQAEELARKIAFHIPENYKDGFWFHAVITVIRTVILALAEDVAEAKKERIDILTVANVLENKQFGLDDFINSRADYSLAKNTYKGIYLMEFETKNRVIAEAIISIKLKVD